MNRYLIGVVSGAIAFAAFAEDCLDLLVPEPQRIVRHGGVVASVEEPEVVCSSIPDAPKAVSDQAYILEISDDGCRITAGGDAGVLYAKATLDQLLALSGGRLPACTITDWPALKWRGFMIDCGRNYLELEGVRAILDMMAAYKMNIFNWSLCNDWGWRLESKKYPQLNDPSVYTRNIGKFYTQDEFREIVCYAAARGVHQAVLAGSCGKSQAWRNRVRLARCYGRRERPCTTWRVRCVSGHRGAWGQFLARAKGRRSQERVSHAATRYGKVRRGRAP